MSKKIASITEDKKLLLTNTIIEDDKYRLSEDGTLYIEEIIEGNSFSIGKNTIEANEFIEGYPLVKPVIDDSLVLWLDGTTGNNYEQTKTWKDLSGNGNHGSLKNFAYNRGSGWVDGGLRFDGVDDQVTIPHNPVLNVDKVTMECWVYVQTYPTDNMGLIIGKWQDAINKRQYALYITTRGYPRFDISDTGKWDGSYMSLTLKKPLPLKIWTHIATTYDGNRKKLFINGVEKASTNYSKGLYKTDVELCIGGYTSGNLIRYFNGIISLARIYNRALTDEEVMQNYKAGQCSPLLAKGE